MTELARATCLLPPSLSRILRDLEARKLVERRPVDNDLRRARISIGPNGVALIEEVAPDSEAIYAEITRRFGAARLAELQGMLAT
ncbi:MarR family transcriptional regulator, partial [Acinetobacter baumannii]